MQTEPTVTDPGSQNLAALSPTQDFSALASQPIGRVIRRNGKLTVFDRSKIAVALTKAFLAVEGGTAAASSRVRETVESLTVQVIDALFRHLPEDGTVHIENIQDQVELALMRNAQQKVARAYVLYREQHAQQRATEVGTEEAQSVINISYRDGTSKPLNQARLQEIIDEAVKGLQEVSAEQVMKATLHGVCMKA